MSAAHHHLADVPWILTGGWTIVHFLWQGLFIAMATAVVMRFLNRSSSSTRYVVASAGMFFMALMPAVTFLRIMNDRQVTESWTRWHDLEGETARRELAFALMEDRVEGKQSAEDDRLGFREPDSVLASSMVVDIWDRPAKFLVEWLRPNLPLVFISWALGVLILSLRLMVGLWQVYLWPSKGVAIRSGPLQEMVLSLTGRMKVRRAFAIMESTASDTPMVVGWRSPVVVIPTKLRASLSLAELEPVLAHEIAHIKRRDYLVNLFQVVVETLLFFSPAVWWLSKLVREERENCCDDLALRVCERRVDYARALMKLELFRTGALGLEMSSSGGTLLRRIRRISLGRWSGALEWWPMSFGLMAMMSIVVGTFWTLVWCLVVPATEAMARLQDESLKATQLSLTASSNVASQAESPVQNSWGRMAEFSGLQSRLTLQTEVPTVGKPLLFRLELRNAGKKETQYDPQQYVPYRVLRVAEVDGKPLPFIGMTPQTSGRPETLQPGEVKLLWENVDASELFLMKSGKLEILAEGGEWAAQSLWRDSNTIQVELRPGQLSWQQAIVDALLQTGKLPEDWKVSVGFGEIYLSHSTTGLKKDVVTLRIWLTTKPLPEGFTTKEETEERDVVSLWKGEQGFLHLSAPRKAKQLWPEFQEVVRAQAERVLHANAR